jgi:hypothetical protein
LWKYERHHAGVPTIDPAQHRLIRAYSDLTDACNSCHQALNHAVVVIDVPEKTNPSDLKAVDASHH